MLALGHVSASALGATTHQVWQGRDQQTCCASLASLGFIIAGDRALPGAVAQAIEWALHEKEKV